MNKIICPKGIFKQLQMMITALKYPTGTLNNNVNWDSQIDRSIPKNKPSQNA